MTQIQLRMFKLIQKLFDDSIKFEALEVKNDELIFRGTDIALYEVIRDLGVGYSIDDIANSTNISADTLTQVLNDLASALKDPLTVQFPAEPVRLHKLLRMAYNAVKTRLEPR